jgi:rod shape-determining protein MreC
LIYFQTTQPGFISYRDKIGWVASPFYFLAELPGELTENSQVFFSSKQSLMDDLTKLRAENLQLRAKLQRFQALQNENLELRKLLGTSPPFAEKTQVARLLSVDVNPFSHRVIINRGKKQGVYKGQPVVDATGIMGMVIETLDESSQVLLITDSKHAIPVLNLRNGLRSIVKGTGESSKMQLLHVTDTQDFKVGDKLVTSGLGGQFPSGYPVGHIVSIKYEPGKPFGNIVIRPSAELNASRQVLLIWPLEQ